MNQSIKQEKTNQDVIKFDIPLLIRVLELAREDIKSDVQLHKMVERIIKIRDRGVLTMQDYSDITTEESQTTIGRSAAVLEILQLSGIQIR